MTPALSQQPGVVPNAYEGGAEMPDRTCSVEGCERPHKARGWCSMHYRRWQNHGDPTAVAHTVIRGSFAERFWPRVNKDGPNGCWIWTGSLDKDGYGQAAIGGRYGSKYKAHRAAYEMLVGPIPEGLALDHECHNQAALQGRCSGGLCIHRICVNPAHLLPATSAENVRRGLSGSNNAVKTHCPQGHPYDEANTRVYNGSRFCRACQRERDKRRRGR